MTNWYVTTLRPGATSIAKPRRGQVESRVGETEFEREMRDAGVSFYLPKMRKEIRYARNRQMVVRSYPLFTGYAFVAVDSIWRDWARLSACRTLGVPLGMRDGSSPIPVPVELISHFQAAEAIGFFDDTKDARIMRGEEARSLYEEIVRIFPAGKRVEAVEGAFSGHHGQVRSVTGKGTIWVMISMFNRMVPKEFEVAELVAA